MIAVEFAAIVIVIVIDIAHRTHTIYLPAGMVRLVGKGFGINVAHRRHATRQWRRHRIISIHYSITIGVLHRFHSHFGISATIHCGSQIMIGEKKNQLGFFLRFYRFFICLCVFYSFLPFSLRYLCVIYFNLFAFAFALNMYLLRSLSFLFFSSVIFVIIINYYWPRLRCVCISLISCKLCVISFSVSAADAGAAAAPL